MHWHFCNHQKSPVPTLPKLTLSQKCHCTSSICSDGGHKYMPSSVLHWLDLHEPIQHAIYKEPKKTNKKSNSSRQRFVLSTNNNRYIKSNKNREDQNMTEENQEAKNQQTIMQNNFELFKLPL